MASLLKRLSYDSSRPIHQQKKPSKALTRKLTEEESIPEIREMTPKEGGTSPPVSGDTTPSGQDEPSATVLSQINMDRNLPETLLESKQITGPQVPNEDPSTSPTVQVAKAAAIESPSHSVDVPSAETKEISIGQHNSTPSIPSPIISAEPDANSTSQSQALQDAQAPESMQGGHALEENTPSLAVDRTQEPKQVGHAVETRENHHKRHDSGVMTSPGRPRRSSSVRTALQSYRKIFSGRKPRNKSPPRMEQVSGEVESLRQTIQKHERDLEEASTTILLQDQVLSKLERQMQNGLPQENVVKDIDIDNMESQTNSKPHELARQIVHLTSELDVKTKELEAAKAAGNSHERKYLELERDSTEAASSKGELTRTVANLKAELETLKAAYGNSASERSKTLEEIEELKSRIATGERELADAKQKATQHALEFSTHRDTSAKDILAAQEATKLSKTDHETLKRALEEAKASEAEAQAKHESAEARLKEAKSAHAETVSSHDATKTELEQKLAEINGYEAEKAALLASHESSSNQKEVDLHSVRLKLADSEMKTDASNERALELSKNLESLTKHHEASKTALLAAQAETKRMQETSNTEHKDALEALAKELELSKTNAASLTSDLDAITKDKDGISKALESATAENELLKSGTADSASKHSALKAQLDELQASSADATKSNKTELDAAHTKIAELSAEIEKHTASRGDSDQTISKLRGELEAHSALQTDFEKAQTRIIALQKDVDGHGSSNAELQKQVNELNSIKAELVTAQAKVAELTTLTDSNAKTKSEVQATHDKAVADLTSSHHEKITTTEAALAAATAKHQNIAESLKSKDKEIASAQEDLSSISKELASTEVALKDAQAALEKEKKNSVEELARKGRDAEERATAAELALKTAKGQHEAERASLSAKLTELENDKSRNGNLLKDLVASKHSEASSRATIARLEKELETLRAKPTSNEANVHVSKIPKAVKETDEKPSKSKVNPVTKVDPVVPEAEAPAEEGTSSEHAQVPEPVDPDKA